MKHDDIKNRGTVNVEKQGLGEGDEVRGTWWQGYNDFYTNGGTLIRKPEGWFVSISPTQDIPLDFFSYLEPVTPG